MKSQSRVSNLDYSKLISAFIHLNYKEDGYLKYVKCLTGQEDHRNRDNEKIPNTDNIPIGSGMSMLLIRIDDRHAQHNLHWGHERDSNSKIPIPYKSDYMRLFKIFEIDPDDIEVVKANHCKFF